MTGVARGSLGTNTALDDTQEWVVPAELRAAPPEPARAPAPAPPPAEAGHEAHPAPNPPSARDAVRAPAPVAAGRASRRQSGLGSPRGAGIAAALLLALIAVTAVLSSTGALDGSGLTPPAAGQETAAPTEAPAAEGGDGDGDGNKGKGKGNGQGGGDEEDDD